MPRRSLPCRRCRRGSPSARGFVEGDELSAQHAAGRSNPTSGSRPAAPASPEVPDPGGAGAALSPVPREAGEASAQRGGGKVKC